MSGIQHACGRLGQACGPRRQSNQEELAASGFAGAAGAAEYTVVLDKMKFGPAPTGLHVGDVVVWRNDDILRHTATARDKSFDVDLPPHSQAKLTLTATGTIDFYCRFHPGMTGTLMVAP